MINKTVALIDKEQTDDAAKVAWCNNEKTVNEENQGYKETDIATLTTNLGPPSPRLSSYPSSPSLPALPYAVSARESPASASNVGGQNF